MGWDRGIGMEGGVRWRGGWEGRERDGGARIGETESREGGRGRFTVFLRRVKGCCRRGGWWMALRGEVGSGQNRKAGQWVDSE